MNIEKANILYIDDEQENLLLFEFAFQKHYNIYLAGNADEAIELLERNNNMQIIISDQRMPGMTGIEFFEVVSERLPDTIRILLTAYTDPQYIIDAINRGKVYHYLNKPYDISYLKNILDKAIETFHLKNLNTILLNDLKKKNEELVANERKFRNVFNYSNDGIVIINYDGVFYDANQRFIERNGLTKEQLFKMNIYDLLGPSQAQKIKLMQPELMEKNELLFELAIERSNGTEYFEANARLIDFEEKEAVLLITRNITDRKTAELNVLQAMSNAEEKERTCIARELHDGLGPTLSVVKLYLNEVEQLKVESEKIDTIQKSVEILDEAIKILEEISNNISPHILTNFGLSAAIESFCNKLRMKNMVKIHLNLIEKTRFNETIEITLYRIAIELIHNSLKHAKAENIYIQLLQNENILELAYKDDGIGFDLNVVKENKKGMGLTNIGNRIKLLNGEFDVITSKENGLQVKIIILIK